MKIVKTDDYQHDFGLLLAKEQKQVRKIEDKLEATVDPTSLDFVAPKPPIEEPQEYSASIWETLLFMTFRIENDQCVLIDVV